MPSRSFLRHSILALIISSSLASSSTIEHNDKGDLAAIALPDAANIDSLPQLVEVHQVVVTVEAHTPPPSPPQDTPRHTVEKKSLLERLERKHGTWNNNHPRWRLLDALHGYAAYSKRQMEELDRLGGLYKRVNKKQKALLEKHANYSNKFTKIESLLSHNQDLANRIVDNALDFYALDRAELNSHIKKVEHEGKKADKVSVSQSLKHIVRDWTSAGGPYEREACFNCLLTTLQALFPDRATNSEEVKILLPGSGLNRLGHEIAQLGGFEVTVNEWSTYMNVLYRYLEAQGHQPDFASVHPFIDSWSHHATTADMLRPLSFPDAPLNRSQVVLVEGDFTTAFSSNTKPSNNLQFDVIVTYFFIDTARNLVSYLETIKTLLRPGGHWVNLGPLLYGSAPFVQLSLEEVLDLVEGGFGFEMRDGGVECGEVTTQGRRARGMEAAYGFDSAALTRNAYDAQFWIARRPA